MGVELQYLVEMVSKTLKSIKTHFEDATRKEIYS